MGGGGWGVGQEAVRKWSGGRPKASADYSRSACGGLASAVLPHLAIWRSGSRHCRGCFWWAAKASASIPLQPGPYPDPETCQTESAPTLGQRGFASCWNVPEPVQWGRKQLASKEASCRCPPSMNVCCFSRSMPPSPLVAAFAGSGRAARSLTCSIQGRAWSHVGRP